MQIEPKVIADIVSAGFRRCAAARMLGGVAAIDVANGADVPDGWQFDDVTGYWVPSLDQLDASNRLQ